MSSTNKRGHRVIALHLIVGWLPKAAPLLPSPPPTCTEHPFDHDLAERECDTTADSNRTHIARLVVAAGRRGAQRLAVAVIAAENDACRAPSAAVKSRYTGIMRALLLFATTTAREFLLTRVTVAKTKSETSTCEGNATHKSVSRTKSRTVTRTIVAAAFDTDDDDAATVDGGAASQPSTPAAAPLTRACLDFRNDGSAESILASLAKAAGVSPDYSDDDSDELTATQHLLPYEAAPGAIAAALRPRELEIDLHDAYDADSSEEQDDDADESDCVNLDDVVPWILTQRQLRTLSVTNADSDGASAIVDAVVAAGAPLEELALEFESESSIATLRSFLLREAVSGSRFPALRVLRVPTTEIRGEDLRSLHDAAPALEVLAGREEKGVTAADWRHLLRRMKRLHTVVISPPTTSEKGVPPLYDALGDPNFTPACRLRVLERTFAPKPDVMHPVLEAIADQLPCLESIALPVEIFNALALDTTADDIAKQELRAAVQAATRRCKRVTLPSRTDYVKLHLDALLEMSRLMPNLRQHAGYIWISSEIKLSASLQRVLKRSNFAQKRDLDDSVSQLRELYLTGALSQTELATVARACPQLRVLHCEYGGFRPLVRLDQASELQFVSLMAEAVFIDWLGAAVDVSAAKHLPAIVSSSGAAAPRVMEPQVLRKLRQLRVETPPFDGERDAAGMSALESVRAHSQVQIQFA